MPVLDWSAAGAIAGILMFASYLYVERAHFSRPATLLMGGIVRGFGKLVKGTLGGVGTASTCGLMFALLTLGSGNNFMRYFLVAAVVTFPFGFIGAIPEDEDAGEPWGALLGAIAAVGFTLRMYLLGEIQHGTSFWRLVIAVAVLTWWCAATGVMLVKLGVFWLECVLTARTWLLPRHDEAIAQVPSVRGRRPNSPRG